MTLNFSLLDAINKPLLLLWGDRDPWIGPKAADAIQELYPKAQRVGLAAGHCPHDEAPELVNAEICKFIDSIEFSS
jgi:pimeloyl-ACP methyl ester carboxylesterase